jgi:hypothetical protein
MFYSIKTVRVRRSCVLTPTRGPCDHRGARRVRADEGRAANLKRGAVDPRQVVSSGNPRACGRQKTPATRGRRPCRSRPSSQNRSPGRP